jgi:flavin reductase (DIM6/NTAB) family NADH-FMN oxidoreductase RutF
VPESSELVGPFPGGKNPVEYDKIRRRVFWTIPSGLFLIGSRSAERRNLMCANWLTQVAREPKLLAVSIERHAHTHDLIHTGRCFAVSILDRADRGVVRRFVTPATDDRHAMTLNGEAYVDAEVSGAPVLAAAIAWLDCAVEREVDFATHTLFVGEVVDAGFSTDVDRVASHEVLRMEDTKMHYGG